MKLLESIALVQFFLYERVDLEIGRNTAFLGPNGTGKSALMDAIQTVMLAADGNRMHFNAAGEGKVRARSLRDYCLGATDQNLCRTQANTYIDLVFRDEETDEVVTAGVSLSASANSPDHVFNGLYLLPGLAISTQDHIERLEGQDSVLPWGRFMRLISDRYKAMGDEHTPHFAQSNREDFMRRFLHALAGPGDRPNAQALRSAFARSLKLAEDVKDISETLRVHMINEYPTNVRKFRERLDQFRAFRDLIERTRKRIERGEEVSQKYAIVRRERTLEANMECLKATYDVERLGETISEGESEVDRLEDELRQASNEQNRIKLEIDQAQQERDRIITALNQDPEYRSQGVQADRLTEIEGQANASCKRLLQGVVAMEHAVRDAGQLPSLSDARGRVENALGQLDQLSKSIGGLPTTEAIQSATEAVAGVYEATRAASQEAETALKSRQAERKQAQMALDRAKSNKAQLKDPTTALQRILAEAGIEATPICDLIAIKEARWQPALEAYLGPHLEALLVPRERETDAINLYRRLKDRSAVYGVKLALPSRARNWARPGTMSYAAELIAGEDRDAVRYVQGELGRLELADSTEELRTGGKSISADGMICSGGGIERRRLPPADEYKVGRNDNVMIRERAESDFRRAEDDLRAAETTAAGLGRALKGLAPFADNERLRAELDELFATTADLKRRENSAREALTLTESDSLAALKEAKLAADKAASDLRDRSTTTAKQIGTLQTKLTTHREQIESLRLQADLAKQAERSARNHSLYDGNEVERHRARLDERYGENWTEKLAACSQQQSRAHSAATNADRDAWTLFCTYVTDYHLTNHDIASSEWARAYAYIEADTRRLRDLELVEHEASAVEAYDAAAKVFRTDVAQALLAGFDNIKEQVDQLNQVLKSAPEFSNGERYQFIYKPVDQHRQLYDFLRGIRELGAEEEDIFGGTGPMPEEFRALVEGETHSDLLADSSPLNDHRRFFAYDVQIMRDDQAVRTLSKNLNVSSGGEHRTPLYVIFGAALAAAYGKTRGNLGGGGLMLLDEAFEKMDPQNVRATAEYLNSLGLQLILACPEDGHAKVSSFLDVYYDMARYGSGTIHMEITRMGAAARELLTGDNFLAHPDLLSAEIERLRSEELESSDER